MKSTTSKDTGLRLAIKSPYKLSGQTAYPFTLSKLTCIASAAIATGIALPILTLDYFLVGIGDYLAALTTTAMAAATIWICLRSLHSNRDAEIRPCEPRGPTSPIATLSLPQQQLPPNPAAKQLPRPANEMPGDTAAASDRSKR